MTKFAPTTEQQAALEAYATGGSLIIEAGAGTGKTATLKLLAESSPDRRGQYIAFNKAIVEEAQARMPGHVNASTAHSLAFRAVGFRYKHRLKSWRMRSDETARRLGIGPITVQVDGKPKMLSAGYLAGLTMRTITSFCQSDDRELSARHVPYVGGIDFPDAQGKMTFANNNRLAKDILPFAVKAWADLQKTDGVLQFKHEHYLKMYELSRPWIAAQVIYFDEAQDVSPVLASIVRQQKGHAQLVYVGDSNQSIYGFTGAVNALAQLNADNRTTLSQSFRFGPAVAEIANRVLELLPTEMRLTGTPSIASVVGPVSEPDAILCRTNAVAVQAMMDEEARGRRAHLVGGGGEVMAFAKGALELQATGHTDHQDLACFDTWAAVQDYVRQDPQGDELKLLVDLIDRFGAAVILSALENMPDEDKADVVISTAHKAKGRQWNSVMLAGDFQADPEKTGEEELRLLYVAVTRARIELDASAIPWLVGGIVAEGTTPPVAPRVQAEPVPAELPAVEPSVVAIAEAKAVNLSLWDL